MSWARTRLKHLAAVPITNGVGEPGTFDDPEWPRYVRTTDIAGPRALRADVFASLPPEIAARAPLQRGDIVMTAAGATVGKSMLFESDEPACYAGYLARFRPASDVDPRFVSYWTESRPYWDQITSGKVVSTIDNFSAGKYQNLWIDVPDLVQQRAVADYLDAETARIDTMLGLLSARQQVLVERLRTMVVADLESAEWPTLPLRRLARRVKTGGTPADGNDGDVPWYTPASFGDRLVLGQPVRTIPMQWVDSGEAVRFEAGSTLIVGIGTVGRVAHLDHVASGNQQLTCIEAEDGVYPRFMSWLLWARSDELRQIAPGTTLRIISNELLKSLPVVCPPTSEQVTLARRWDMVAEQVTSVGACTERLVDLLLERRHALITAAVTGELKIPGVAA